MPTDSAYAQVVTEQYNPNTKQLTHWSNKTNMFGHNGKYATALFTKEKYVTKWKEVTSKDKNGKKVVSKVPEKYGFKYNHPWTISAHDFNLNIPDGAVLKSIKFKIRMRVDWKVTTKRPTARFNVYGTTYEEADGKSPNKETGYHNGVFFYRPNLNISKDFYDYTYTMNESQIKEGNFESTYLNKSIFGVDFIFNDAEFDKENDEGTIYVEWIQCVVEYDVVDPVLYWTCDLAGYGTVANPVQLLENESYRLTLEYNNKSNARGDSISIPVTFPFGFDYHVHSHHGSWDSSTRTWTIPQEPKGVKKIVFDVTPHKCGEDVIYAKIGDKRYRHTVFVNQNGIIDGYNVVTASPINEFHINHLSCMFVRVRGEPLSTTIPVVVYFTNSKYKSIELVMDMCQNVASMDNFIENETNITFTINLDKVEDYFLTFKLCMYPTASPCSVNFNIDYHDTAKQFECLPSYTYLLNSTNTEDSFEKNGAYYKCGHIGTDTVKVVDHRVVSEMAIETDMIPCVSDEVDATMIVSDCRINMSIWEDLDYIGCVPLEHLHFNPKSTYKDTLINSTYKNKRYMGKKLATDEDISLNVRLHPQQVTTIQGLIDMDKPIPINANHRCFEGDALNHRGWAEIYSIKAEETNPHWYKCDIDVKYLTHNLNTRFKIHKGEDVNDYDIPSLFAETYESGQNLSDTDYFNTETDGTFYYNGDNTIVIEFRDEENHPITVNGNSTSYTYTNPNGDETTVTGLDNVVEAIENHGYEVVTPLVTGQTIKVYKKVYIDPLTRNTFGLDNKQYVTITTASPVTHNSKIKHTWSSTLLTEERENHISRITRIFDKNTQQVIFEYEYEDIEITDDGVTAQVVYRGYDKNGKYYSNNIGNAISFRFSDSDVAYDEDIITSDSDEDLEGYGNSGEAQYGTSLNFEINKNNLTIIDEGFNGKEIEFTTTLLDGEYMYQVEWVNNNSDAESEQIDCLFDFEVMDTVLTSTYADKYGNIVISPFPVADKKILFTREAEEGTIYYYQDDKEEFSYLVEPYYQYMNGCDLVTKEGVSIFNLNYGYDIVYIQNGIVRLGFNRLDERGYMYLGKYDSLSDTYITTHRLHLGKYADVNLNSITDDKIEVQASDCVFTIYRGHPYIKIKHELEDIWIDNVFNMVWAEKVGGNAPTELPAYWDLGNTQNLLDADVGGSGTIKPNRITVSEDTDQALVDKIEPTLSFVNPSSTVETGTEITFTLSSSTLTNYYDVIDIDDTSCSFGTLEWDVECDNVPDKVSNIDVGSNVIQTGDTTKVMARVVDSCGHGVEGQTVSFYEEYTPNLVLSSDNSVVQSGDDATISIKLKDSDGSLISLEDKSVKLYEVYTPTLSVSADKDVIQSSDTSTVSIVCRDSNDGNIVPLNGVSVKLYEVFTPSLTVSTDSQVVQSGSTIGVSAKLKDTSDGSAIKGQTVYFYVDE